MIDVSNGWKLNQQKNFVSESYIRIVFNIADPDLIDSATVATNGHESYSDVTDLLIGDSKNMRYYATLEPNFWLLNGSREVLTNDTSVIHNGYVGDEFSDSQGLFETTPQIEIEFGNTQGILLSGLTINWTSVDIGEYAIDFRVDVFDGANIIKTVNVTDNQSVTSILQSGENIENYSKIRITINKWCLPNRRPRISDLVFGINKVYTKRDLIEYKHTIESDPLSATLPKNEIKISINNIDNTFDPNNEDGLYQYLIQRRMFDVEYGYMIDNQIEWIPAGQFYLSEWETPQNSISADFTARDVLEFMSNNYIKGKHVTTPKTLYDLAVEVLESANLPTNNWRLSDTLKDYSTVAPLPMVSHAECLQYIAQAGKCTFYVDREGTIIIEPNDMTVSDYNIDTFNSYSYPEISLFKSLKSVIVKVFSYNSVNKRTVYSEVIDFGENANTKTIRISYSEMATNIVATITGDDVAYDPLEQSYYANACVLKLTGRGEVYIDIEGDVFEDTSIDYILEVNDEGEEQIVNNPLITNQEWARDVAEWVKEWLTKREQLTADFRADPRLDSGDVISIDNKFGTDTMKVTSVEYQYKGSFNGKVKGIKL